MCHVSAEGVEKRMITVHYYFDAVGRAPPVGLYDCTQCPVWIQLFLCIRVKDVSESVLLARYVSLGGNSLQNQYSCT